MHIYVIGTGPGNPDLLTVQAKRAIEASTLLVGDKRMLEPFEGTGKELVRTYRRDEICRLAASRTEEDGPGIGGCRLFQPGSLIEEHPGLHRDPYRRHQQSGLLCRGLGDILE